MEVMVEPARRTEQLESVLACVIAILALALCMRLGGHEREESADG